MNKKPFLFLLTAVIAAMAFLPASAESGKPVFDYSAEKMDCSILHSAVDNEKADRNRELLGDVTDLDWSIGPEDAVLTIIEYADFQCPYCADASLQLLDYQKKHSDEVRLVYRHFPLSFHEKAVPAALAADAAGYQGLFFEAEDLLFEKQSEWSALGDNNAFSEWLVGEFSQIPELDFDLWYLAFTDSDNELSVRNSYSKVVKTGIVGGTPTVFLNYADSNYMFDEASLDTLLEKLKSEKNRILECPDVVIKQDIAYQAVLETETGDIHIDLYSDTAPFAVNSFIYLAESGWYDGNFLWKGQDGSVGIVNGQGTALPDDPGYSFPMEFDGSRIFDGAGYVGLAGLDNGQAGSNFFITNDIPSVFESSIRQNIGDQTVPENTIKQYAGYKTDRFSRVKRLISRLRKYINKSEAIRFFLSDRFAFSQVLL